MLNAVAFTAAGTAVRVLPPGVTRVLGRTLARAACRLPLPARRAARGNLERIAPLAGRDLVRAAFEHFALATEDFLRLGALDPRALAAAVEVRGREHLERAEASGRGVIVVSAHLGNWEWGAAFLAARRQGLLLVARPHAEPWVERFFARRRARFGVERLEGRPLWRRAAEALRRGRWLAVMGDRRLDGRTPGCGFAAALARRTGALLLPGVCVRTGPGRYAACFAAPLPGGRPAPAPGEALRAFVARWPEQWCAFEPAPEGLA